MDDLGQRVAAIGARFEAFEQYSHERWHSLSNDLQPLVQLPTVFARDFAMLEGRLAGNIEAAVAKAIDKALAPVNQDIAKLQAEVAALGSEKQRMTGARLFGIWFVQTAIAAMAAIIAVTR
jgi:hypothetical protein